MTAWARLARENSEQSCGNGGAMESQQPAFHSSLGISQKTRDSHIPTAPATGCFTGTKKDSKTKNESRLHKSLDTAWQKGMSYTGSRPFDSPLTLGL